VPSLRLGYHNGSYVITARDIYLLAKREYPLSPETLVASATGYVTGAACNRLRVESRGAGQLAESSQRPEDRYDLRTPPRSPPK
jgi:hypothetical protein